MIWPTLDQVPAGKAPGPDAQALADLCNKLLAAADHWVTLGQVDRAIQCHQAAALYANASALAYQNGV